MPASYSRNEGGFRLPPTFHWSHKEKRNLNQPQFTRITLRNIRRSSWELGCKELNLLCFHLLITSSSANCCIEGYRFSEVRIYKVNLTKNKSFSYYLSSYLFFSGYAILYKYLLEKKTNRQTKRMKSIITLISSVFEHTKQLCNETAKLFNKYTNRYRINNYTPLKTSAGGAILLY